MNYVIDTKKNEIRILENMNLETILAVAKAVFGDDWVRTRIIVEEPSQWVVDTTL